MTGLGEKKLQLKEGCHSLLEFSLLIKDIAQNVVTDLEE
jgi:hypothetical protein